MKGYKKILVLYTNYGKKRKPEKTNWVMHQYHLGNNEEEKDGELVVSKVFYQTQPRQCNSSSTTSTSIVKDISSSVMFSNSSKLPNHGYDDNPVRVNKESNNNLNIEYYNPNSTHLISYDQGGENRESSSHHHHHHQLIPNFVLHQAGGSSFLT